MKNLTKVGVVAVVSGFLATAAFATDSNTSATSTAPAATAQPKAEHGKMGHKKMMHHHHKKGEKKAEAASSTGTDTTKAAQ